MNLPNITAGLTVGSAVSAVTTHGTNGLIRITALMANIWATAMVAELAFRGVASSLEMIGLGENKNLTNIGNFVRSLGARPYGNLLRYRQVGATVGGHEISSNDSGKTTYAISTFNLLKKAAIVTVAAAALWEGATLLCGPAPRVYNDVLTLIGPLRLAGGSYIQNVSALLKEVGIL